MKQLKLETESTVTLYETGEVTSYPIPSIRGIAGAGGAAGRGWITRKMAEPTIVIAASPLDSMTGGLALRLHDLLSAFELCEEEFVNEVITRRDTQLTSQAREIEKLQKENTKLAERIKRLQRKAM